MSVKLAALLARQQQRVKARDTGGWDEKERILLDSCHPKQRQFVLDDGRRIAALTSRGCGKTTGSRARLLRRMLRTSKARVLFVATTREQAEHLMWGPLKDLLEKLGIEARFNETKLRCTLRRNGAILRLVGADNKHDIEKLRGQPFHEVIIDEAASHAPHLLENLLYRIIGPRLGDYGGRLVLVGTPGHVLAGPFYEATRPGTEIGRPYEDRSDPEFAGWKGWSTHHWELEDGAPYVPEMARLWKEALVEKEANGWSDDHPVWLREYRGRWAADGTENVFRYRPHLDDGHPWNQWDPERDPRTGLAKLPDDRPGWLYVYGMDLGHSDPFALEVFAFNPAIGDRTLYHVYEFHKRGMYARPIAELLLGVGDDGEPRPAESPRGLIGETDWPVAAVADMASLGGALLKELANVYGIRIEPAEKKNKFDSIELANGDLLDGRIKILKGSVLEEQLMSLQWDVDDYGNLKESRSARNDAADAFIYARRAAQHLFTDDPPPPPKPRPGSAEALEAEEAELEREGDGWSDLLSDAFDDEFWG